MINKEEIIRRVTNRLTGTDERNRENYKRKARKILEKVDIEKLVEEGIIAYMEKGGY